VYVGKCGNGIVEDDEECDDGNNKNRDGCKRKCEIMKGWSCFEDMYGFSHCEKTAKCGDGEVQPREDCDDGNNNNGDGCSSKCKVEKKYKCPHPYRMDPYKKYPSKCVRI
jgi:cysteine-rich repeat protein